MPERRAVPAETFVKVLRRRISAAQLLRHRSRGEQGDPMKRAEIAEDRLWWPPSGLAEALGGSSTTESSSTATPTGVSITRSGGPGSSDRRR